MPYDLKDEGKVLRAGVINKALSGRFVSVRRLMRDLETIDDHYDRSNDTGSIKALLMKMLDTGNKDEAGDRANNTTLQSISDRLDKLEARGQ